MALPLDILTTTLLAGILVANGPNNSQNPQPSDPSPTKPTTPHRSAVWWFGITISGILAGILGILILSLIAQGLLSCVSSGWHALGRRVGAEEGSGGAEDGEYGPDERRGSLEGDRERKDRAQRVRQSRHVREKAEIEERRARRYARRREGGGYWARLWRDWDEDDVRAGARGKTHRTWVGGDVEMGMQMEEGPPAYEDIEKGL